MAGTRVFACAYGLVFLALGLFGFVPGLLEPFTDTSMQGHAKLFGLFPVNAAHNFLHLAFGLWGLAAFGTGRGVLLYARVTAIVFAILAIIGLVPGLNDLGGHVPLYGSDVWLHAVLAVIAGYMGFVRHDHRRTGLAL